MATLVFQRLWGELMSRRFVLVALLLLPAGCEDAAAPGAIPAPPEAFVATPKTGEILLEWRDAAQNEQGYRVEVSRDGLSWSLLVEAGPNVVIARHANVEPGASYSYRVAACNSAGCSAFASASAKAGRPPALAAFSVTDIGAYNATFRMSAHPEGSPTRFWFVLRKVGSSVPAFTSETLGPYEGSDTLTSVSYVLFNLEQLTNYEVTAYAENAFGQAPPSAPTAFKTSDTGPPTIGRMFIPSPGRWHTIINPHGLITYSTFELIKTGESFDKPLQTRTAMAPPITGEHTIEAKFSGITTGQSYSWRVISENAAGRAVSPVQTFIY